MAGAHCVRVTALKGCKERQPIHFSNCTSLNVNTYIFLGIWMTNGTKIFYMTLRVYLEMFLCLFRSENQKINKNKNKIIAKRLEKI